MLRKKVKEEEELLLVVAGLLEVLSFWM